ncbi:MAG: T9SS type A sorting domain-containing protein [Crocinitomicaceae bacterium]|nr:choice-of-anchor J domain-containing protein [Flavobacteriales bacterium]NQZ37805.1 T9SS type A sorting domain-containing protein [Crocinitomicaceae bacterium]
MTKGLIIGIFAISSITSIAQTEIFNEDFESGAPVAFTIVDNDGMTPNAATAQFTEAWTRMADPSNTSDTVMGSTSYFDPTGTASRWLITPPLALGAFGNFLYWEARSHDPSYPDNYSVLVSTTDDQISSFTDTVGLIQQEYATWFTRDIDLSANGYASQTIYIAFVNTTNNGFALYVDDIRAVIEDPVGINELVEIAVTVYPNPVSDVLMVQSEANIESLELVSLSGARLMSTTDSEINVSSLTSGSYFVKIVTDQGTVVRSFVRK